jgi:tetratricopeptide (TPR) repeat protein
MGSRLLARLQARIAEERDPVRNACLRAQRAVHLARQGSHDEAQAEVRALRTAFAERPNAEVTAWISLAEAVDSFYRHPGPQALDRLKRAQALARAIGHVELQAVCAAWLAHLEFNANRMETMVQHAAEALRLARPEHHAALARVSLVVADAYHFAGRFDLAKAWYAAVREHALADGDDAMISAMLHNVATFRASTVRLSELFSGLNREQASLAMMQAQSTENYDLGIGTASLTWFVPLIRAQLLTSDAKFAEAAGLFSAHLEDAKEQGLARLLPSFYADYAWCCIQLGRRDEATGLLKAALSHVAPGCDPDDLATTYGRAANIVRTLGDEKRADGLRELAVNNLDAHHVAQITLLTLLVRGLAGAQPTPAQP